MSRLKGSWLFWRREEDLVSQLGHVSRRLRFDFARIINDRLLVGSLFLYLYQIIFILKKSGAGLAGEEWLKGLFNGRRKGSHGVGPCECGRAGLEENGLSGALLGGTKRIREVWPCEWGLGWRVKVEGRGFTWRRTQ